MFFKVILSLALFFWVTVVHELDRSIIVRSINGLVRLTSRPSQTAVGPTSGRGNGWQLIVSCEMSRLVLLVTLCQSILQDTSSYQLFYCDRLKQ